MKKKNKITFLTMLLAAASLLMQSCGKDNLKYPTSTIKGRITYQGQPVGLVYNNGDILTGGTTSQLLFQQVKGPQNRYAVGEFGVYPKHDGTFASKFYNGDYLVRVNPGRSPFQDFSNKPFTVNGDANLGDIEVVPYWWMNNFATTYAGGVFTATFNLTKPSADATKTLQNVNIYITPTNLPDAVSATVGATRSFAAGVNAGGIVVPAAVSTGGPVTVRIDLNTLSTGEKQFLRALGGNGTVYATVAVKTLNINDALYSDVIKLQLP